MKPKTDQQDRQARFRALIQGEFRPEFNREVAIAVRRALRAAREKQNQQPALEQQQAVRQALVGAQAQLWRAQEAEARRRYPTLSLEREMENPGFARLLTDRQSPMTVRQAYEAVHVDEICQQAARAAALETARRMEMLLKRPRESGVAPQAGLPAHLGASDPKTRAAIARRALRGERITL